MQFTLEDLEPFGQGVKDAATGLYESYSLPDGHPLGAVEPQWQTLRTTTDKLAGTLNSESENGRVVHSIHFAGGRDWVVITCKPVKTAIDVHVSEFTKALQAGRRMTVGSLR